MKAAWPGVFSLNKLVEHGNVKKKSNGTPQELGLSLWPASCCGNASELARDAIHDTVAGQVMPKITKAAWPGVLSLNELVEHGNVKKKAI